MSVGFFTHTERMKKCALAGAVVLVVCLWATAAVCVRADHVPYRYNISLDEPPKKRYYAVVRDICRDPVHKQALLAVYDSIAAEAANYTGIAGFYMRQHFPDVYEELEFVPFLFAPTAMWRGVGTPHSPSRLD